MSLPDRDNNFQNRLPSPLTHTYAGAIKDKTVCAFYFFLRVQSPAISPPLAVGKLLHTTHAAALNLKAS